METRIENRLQETLNDLKKSQFESFSKFRQDESSSLTLNQSRDTGKRNQGQDISYPCIKVEFSRWEDRDPTSWISKVENFFHFHRTPEESKVEIASIQLDEDVIQ